MITSYWIMGEFSMHGWQFPYELFIAELLFFVYAKRKEKFPLRFGLSASLYMLCWFFIPPNIISEESAGRILFTVYGIIYCIVALALSVFAMRQCFDETIWNVLFRCIAGYCVQHLSYGLYSIIVLSIAQGNFLLQYLFMAVCYVVLFLIFARRLRSNESIDVGNKEIVLISVVVIAVNIILSMLRGIEDRGPITSVVEGTYASIVCIVVLCYEFSLLSKYKLQRQKDAVQHMWELDKAHYELRKENVEAINTRFHDLKHVIHTLQKDLSQSTIQELENAAGIYDCILNTGNEAVDVVLTEKNLYCKKNHIGFTCMLCGKSLMFMDTVDIYCLFGNALDNAIEAVSKLQEVEKRQISLTMKETGRMLLISIENYCTHSLTIEDGYPVTTKEDSLYHGFGMRSMERIAKKYGGYIQFGISGNTFGLKIFLPRP